MVMCGRKSLTIIDNDAHYRDVLRRIDALQSLIASLRAIEAEAQSERALGRLEDEDVRDVSEAGPLGDAVANLSYTVRHLTAAAADWEAFTDYGSRAASGAG